MANKNLTTAGGELHRIKRKSDVELQTNHGEVKVTDVLYSLSITRNLLSIGCLVDDERAILFTRIHVHILDSVKKLKIVGVGYKDF